MSIHFRNYTNERGYTDDFKKVCDFLIRINKDTVITPNYLWARWIWQFGPYMNMDNLSCIGICEDDGDIVGLATYEGNIGEALIINALKMSVNWSLIRAGKGLTLFILT